MIIFLITSSCIIAPVSASDEDIGYVRELIFAQDSTSGEDALGWLYDNGYEVMDVLLCGSSDGKQIYIGYKTTGNADEVVTGIASNHFRGSTEQSFNNITYTAIGGYDTTESKYLDMIDLDDAAGGESIHLYYTKDKNAGGAITALTADELKNLDGWYTLCRDGSNEPSGFRYSGSEGNLYIHYRRSAEYFGSAVAKPTIIVIAFGMTLIVLGALLTVVIRSRKNST